VKRRDCIGLLAAAALWPAWLRRAFADVTVRGTAPLHIVAPTLVLIIPQKDDDKLDRGQAFGELLNYGSDHDLAPLALVDVVCLPAARLDVAGDPLMVFVDGDKKQILDGKLPALFPRNQRGEYVYTDENASTVTPRRMALLAALIQRALGPRRAADARGDGALAEVARARYVERAPAGTHWARDGGCGVDVEHAPELSDNVDCGMGHVPYRSARFLFFFTRRMLQ
jgi:hypothetical protein